MLRSKCFSFTGRWRDAAVRATIRGPLRSTTNVDGKRAYDHDRCKQRSAYEMESPHMFLLVLSCKPSAMRTNCRLVHRMMG